MGQPYYLALLAEAFGQAARPEAGLTVLAEALTLVATTEERWWEAELSRLMGALQLQLPIPDVPQAEACFQKALDVARGQQAKALELRAAISLSRLWQRQGKHEAARQVLAEVYGWFTEGFDTHDSAGGQGPPGGALVTLTYPPLFAAGMGHSTSHRATRTRIVWPRSRTYSTERAIPRHKLYPFAGKGLSAFVGPPDNFRYLPEPVLSRRFRSSKGPLTDRFRNKLPGPDVKTVMLRACSTLYGVSAQLPCRRSYICPCGVFGGFGPDRRAGSAGDAGASES